MWSNNLDSREQLALKDSISNIYYDEKWHFLDDIPPALSLGIMENHFFDGNNDKCVWLLGSDGDFKVRDVYKKLCHSNVTLDPWQKVIWKEFLPPSRSLTCWHWVALQLRMFYNTGLSGVPAIGLSQHGPNPISQWTMGTNFSTQVRILLTMAIASCVWLLWRTKNNCVFEEGMLDINIFLRQLWRCIKELDFFKIIYATSMEDLRILRLFGMDIRPKKAPKIVLVIWYPPLDTWIKCNKDGCVLRTPRTSRMRGIFSNLSVFALETFTVRIESTFAVEAGL